MTGKWQSPIFRAQRTVLGIYREVGSDRLLNFLIFLLEFTFGNSLGNQSYLAFGVFISINHFDPWWQFLARQSSEESMGVVVPFYVEISPEATWFGGATQLWVCWKRWAIELLLVQWGRDTGGGILCSELCEKISTKFFLQVPRSDNKQFNIRRTAGFILLDSPGSETGNRFLWRILVSNHDTRAVLNGI